VKLINRLTAGVAFYPWLDAQGIDLVLSRGRMGGITLGINQDQARVVEAADPRNRDWECEISAPWAVTIDCARDLAGRLSGKILCFAPFDNRYGLGERRITCPIFLPPETAPQDLPDTQVVEEKP